MPKSTNEPKVPTYLRHRGGGRDRAFCYLAPPGGGKRRRVYLGRWNSPESKRRFREIVGRYLLDPDTVAATPAPADIGAEDADAVNIDEVAAAFLKWKEDRVSKSEWSGLYHALLPMTELYGDVAAVTFGPKKLRLVREHMVEGRRLARREINRRVVRIRACFKWAASEELVPAAIYQALRTLEPLRRGQTTAHETPPVLPVPEVDIEATLEHATPTVRTMARLQLLCGARPGELVALRRRDIDTDGPGGTWVGTPATHKNAWRDHARRLVFGPRAKELLAPYMQGDPEGFVFTPQRSEDERRFLRRQKRQSKLTPSQRERDRRNREAPQRTLQDRWTTDTYGRAIRHACKAAKAALRRKLGELEERIEEVEKAASRRNRRELTALREQAKQLETETKRDARWTPGRLRHNFESTVEAQFGVERAAKALGHAEIGTTQHYRDRRDLTEAVEVAKALG